MDLTVSIAGRKVKAQSVQASIFYTDTLWSSVHI